jgi:hypothetical protein
MRVWIVWCWYEVTLIASWLPEVCTIDCFIDWAIRPATSKSIDDILPRVQQGVKYLHDLWVEYIIVPPYLEHLNIWWDAKIVPFFQTYLTNYVFAQSRVGKLWILGMHWSTWEAYIKEIIENAKKNYQLTDYQKITKIFSSNFPYRNKSCAHWQTHLLYARKRTRIMNRLIKDDLRYFKDCAVDTLIPMDWWVIYREKAIYHRLWAKMKFHGQQAVREVLIWLLAGVAGESTSLCRVRVTAYPEDILENKTRKQLLDRWGKRVLEINRISL